jgi:hypothetical protein
MCTRRFIARTYAKEIDKGAEKSIRRWTRTRTL